ncbi:predicted protein [Lichtheimia corymbifera JMRC:FSU:9682]|uniref:Uncharacterized protein n=1 Tax=Lichtheimia corymbifera JMRC:FSU:9682 TaxID=1263082 RepID=A0A068S363_9FUNG|nr:predicted protein [Lichtheimia corymbifera JMRC:FSU:9682]
MKQKTSTSGKEKSTRAKAHENTSTFKASSSSKDKNTQRSEASSSKTPSSSSSSSKAKNIQRPEASSSKDKNTQPSSSSKDKNVQPSTSDEAKGNMDETPQSIPAKRQRPTSDQEEGQRKRPRERFSEIDVEMFFDYWRRAGSNDRPSGTTRRLTERYMEGRQYQKETGEQDVDWIWFDVLDKFMKRLQTTKQLDLDHLLDDNEQTFSWNIPPLVRAKDKLPRLETMTEDKVMDALKEPEEDQDLSDLVKWTELASDWIDKCYNEAMENSSEMKTYMSQYAGRLSDFISKFQEESSSSSAKSST